MHARVLIQCRIFLHDIKSPFFHVLELWSCKLLLVLWNLPFISISILNECQDYKCLQGLYIR